MQLPILQRVVSISPAAFSLPAFVLSVCVLTVILDATHAQSKRPNVLVAVSDDQSYPHASAYGAPVIQTPGFDEVARRGMLFHSAFTPAPGCSPMRAAFLTGKYIWQLGAAGTHGSHFPAELRTFPSELASVGYKIGATGKGWGPGRIEVTGRKQNPAGPSYSGIKSESPEGISNTDYAANFEAFLDERNPEQPFCFWFGGHEPHRKFGKGVGKSAGMNPDDVEVPSFLPDSPEVRSDLLDYFYEIQWFDQHLAKMLRMLEKRGELDNTLVIVTSDNGMSFPRAKANLYEFGIHMPLAIALPSRFQGDQQTDALVNLIDVTATIYDACEVEPPSDLSGTSLIDLLAGNASLPREATWSGRERHSSSRWNSLGYPCRCVRTAQFLYIKNFAPERWPAGTPRKYANAKYRDGVLTKGALGPEHGGYHDIDACPTLDYMIGRRGDHSVESLFTLAVAKRPAEELYDIRTDAACLTNLATDSKYLNELERHRQLLSSKLQETGDLRETDFAASHIWETYPRYSQLRWFPEPDWAKEDRRGLPTQTWLEDRRPRE